MENFYTVFPEMKSKDVRRSVPSPQPVADSTLQTYLAGESFAGQYIPYFGKLVFLISSELRKLTLSNHKADALLDAPAFSGFPLQGIAIGNGWIDPKEQYQGYVDFAYEKGLIKQGSKVRRYIPDGTQSHRSHLFR